VWTQDFPRKTIDSPTTSEFEDDLVRYMFATGWRGGDDGTGVPVTAATLRCFDYSAAGAKIIASVPGVGLVPTLNAGVDLSGFFEIGCSAVTLTDRPLNYRGTCGEADMRVTTCD
jgi:hypothetical protein